MTRPYAEAEYRAALVVLGAGEHRCWHGCGRVATSPDHVPALADHRHVAGSGCCRLLPSCRPCQHRTGAATGNRRRRGRTVARLGPGSGWSAS